MAGVDMCLLLVVFVMRSVHGQTVLTGTDGYITYHVGGELSTIILTAPHGGSLRPSNVTDREAAGCYDSVNQECVYTKTCSPVDSDQCEANLIGDAYTKPLTLLLAKAIKSELGGGEEHSPHVIINELRRKKLDANRHKAEATFGDPKAMVAWEEYHSFINMAKAAATAGGRNAFYVDMHGHIQDPGWTILGYLLPKRGSNGIDQEVIPDRLSSYSSIGQLQINSGDSMENIVRGDNSIGGWLEAQGLWSVPSPSDKNASTYTYFSGGYNLQRHSGLRVSGVQVEVHCDIRFGGEAARVEYAAKLARAIVRFCERYL